MVLCIPPSGLGSQVVTRTTGNSSNTNISYKIILLVVRPKSSRSMDMSGMMMLV